jgi:hypothetical protein
MSPEPSHDDLEAMLRRLPGPPPPPDLEARLLADVPLPRRRLRWVGVAAAAALLVAAGLVAVAPRTAWLRPLEVAEVRRFTPAPAAPSPFDVESPWLTPDRFEWPVPVLVTAGPSDPMLAELLQ